MVPIPGAMSIRHCVFAAIGTCWLGCALYRSIRTTKDRLMSQPYTLHKLLRPILDWTYRSDRPDTVFSFRHVYRESASVTRHSISREAASSVSAAAARKLCAGKTTKARYDGFQWFLPTYISCYPYRHRDAEQLDMIILRQTAPRLDFKVKSADMRTEAVSAGTCTMCGFCIFQQTIQLSFSDSRRADDGFVAFYEIKPY